MSGRAERVVITAQASTIAMPLALEGRSLADRWFLLARLAHLEYHVLLGWEKLMRRTLRLLFLWRLRNELDELFKGKEHIFERSLESVS